MAEHPRATSYEHARKVTSVKAHQGRAQRDMVSVLVVSPLPSRNGDPDPLFGVGPSSAR
jgi:hypothetical protein